MSLNILNKELGSYEPMSLNYEPNNIKKRILMRFMLGSLVLLLYRMNLEPNQQMNFYYFKRNGSKKNKKSSSMIFCIPYYISEMNKLIIIPLKSGELNG